MKLTKTINVDGVKIPAGTVLAFEDGVASYESVEVELAKIPDAAIGAFEHPMPKGPSKEVLAAVKGAKKRKDAMRAALLKSDLTNRFQIMKACLAFTQMSRPTDEDHHYIWAMQRAATDQTQLDAVTDLNFSKRGVADYRAAAKVVIALHNGNAIPAPMKLGKAELDSLAACKSAKDFKAATSKWRDGDMLKPEIRWYCADIALALSEHSSVLYKQGGATESEDAGLDEDAAAGLEAAAKNPTKLAKATTVLAPDWSKTPNWSKQPPKSMPKEGFQIKYAPVVVVAYSAKMLYNKDGKGYQMATLKLKEGDGRGVAVVDGKVVSMPVVVEHNEAEAQVDNTELAVEAGAVKWTELAKPTKIFVTEWDIEKANGKVVRKTPRDVSVDAVSYSAKLLLDSNGTQRFQSHVRLKKNDLPGVLVVDGKLESWYVSDEAKLEFVKQHENDSNSEIAQQARDILQLSGKQQIEAIDDFMAKLSKADEADAVLEQPGNEVAVEAKLASAIVRNGRMFEAGSAVKLYGSKAVIAGIEMASEGLNVVIGATEGSSLTPRKAKSQLEFVKPGADINAVACALAALIGEDKLVGKSHISDKQCDYDGAFLLLRSLIVHGTSPDGGYYNEIDWKLLDKYKGNIGPDEITEILDPIHSAEEEDEAFMQWIRNVCKALIAK